MTPPHTGTCVWGCGKTDLNKEHVIGEQIAKLMDLEYPVRMHWGSWEGRNDTTLRVVLKRRVCTGCNGHWMGRLDDAFVGVMRDALSDDEPVHLNANAQTILSTWATKVALLLELFMHDFARNRKEHPDTFVPDDNFPALYEGKEPPSRTQVWLGAVDKGSVPPFTSIGGGLIVPATGPGGFQIGEERGYFSMWSLHGLLFRVSGWEEGWKNWKAVEHTAPTVNPNLVPIWPIQSDVVEWPPPRLSVSDLVAASQPRMVTP